MAPAAIRISSPYLLEWRKLRNEELHDLYSSQNIFRVIISRRMRWAEHVALARIGAYRVLVGKPEVRDRLTDLGVHGGIILKLILKKLWDGVHWIDLAENRDRWRAVVKRVMNIQVP
jgi:hypothetical protein